MPPKYSSSGNKAYGSSSRYAPQPLFDAVDHVKEIALVDLQPPAAKAPLRVHEKVKLENLKLVFVQRPLADETEVGDVLLVLPAPKILSTTSPGPSLQLNRGTCLSYSTYSRKRA